MILITLFIIIGLLPIVVGIIKKLFFDDHVDLLLHFLFTLLSSVLFIGLFGFMIKLGGTITPKQYVDLKVKTEFIMSQDSVPFQMKSELYDEVLCFNSRVNDKIELKDNIWVGWYNDNLDPSISKIDISKFK
jgi:hypothetical protein